MEIHLSSRSIFMPAEQKELVSAHNTFANDVVGVFAFSMGIAALASSNPTGLSSIAFIFCCVWMIYKGLLIYPLLRRVYRGVEWWKQCIDGCLENLIYLLGLGFLGLIGFEVVTLETFLHFSLAHMLLNVKGN